MDIIGIIGTVFSVAVGLIPVAVVIIKKAGKVAKESGELLVAVSKALEDGKLSGDEIRTVISEAKDVGTAVMDVRNKTVTAK